MTDEGARETIVAWVIEKRLTGWPPGRWDFDDVLMHQGEKPNKPPSPNGAYEYRSRALVFRAALTSQPTVTVVALGPFVDQRCKCQGREHPETGEVELMAPPEGCPMHR